MKTIQPILISILSTIVMQTSVMGYTRHQYNPADYIDTQTPYGACALKCQQQGRTLKLNGAGKVKTRSVDHDQAKKNWQNTGTITGKTAYKTVDACLSKCNDKYNQKMEAATYMARQAKKHKQAKADAAATEQTATADTQPTYTVTPVDSQQ